MAEMQRQYQQPDSSSSTSTVLSVPIMNPFYRDLLALKHDYAQNQAQLKLTQQTLQQTYHDLMLAQEQKRKAETDAIQLRLQWDNIVKRHLDHLPERQLLVHQVAQLKEELEKERQLRTALQREQGTYIQEILKLKADLHSIKATAVMANASSSSSSSVFVAPPTRSSSSSSSGGGGGVVGFFFPRQSAPSVSSQHASASPPSSLLSASSPPAPVHIILPPKHAPSSQYYSTPSTAPSSVLSPTASLDSSNYSTSSSWPSDGSSTTTARTSFSASSISQDESQEYLEAEKAYYEQLRQENAALVTTVQELKDMRGREQESKQANALVLAQADLDLLRGDQAATQARLEARSSLVHAFAATVNAQATEIERLTMDRGRHQVARAQVEQELVCLIDASLSTLQRLLDHLQSGYRQIVETALEPMRQTVECLDVPAIRQDWERCELAVQQCWRGLEESLMRMQQAQEFELLQKSRGTCSSSSSTSSSFSLVSPPSRSSVSSEQQPYSTILRGTKPPAIITNMEHAGDATAAATTADLDTPYASSSASPSSQWQNGANRQEEVIMARKAMADTYLEDCVVSVEQLARDKRILQQLVVDLRKEKAAQDEEALVKKLKSLDERIGGDNEQHVREQDQQERRHEQQEHVSSPQQHTGGAVEKQGVKAEDDKGDEEMEMTAGVEVDDCGNVEDETRVSPVQVGDPTTVTSSKNDSAVIAPDYSSDSLEVLNQSKPEKQDLSSTKDLEHIQRALERIARLEKVLATTLAWIVSIDSLGLKFSGCQCHHQQNRVDGVISNESEEVILALDVREASSTILPRSLRASLSQDIVTQPPVPNVSTCSSSSSTTLANTEVRVWTPHQIASMIQQELNTNDRNEVATTSSVSTCHIVADAPAVATANEPCGDSSGTTQVHKDILGESRRQLSSTITTEDLSTHGDELLVRTSCIQPQYQHQHQNPQADVPSGGTGVQGGSVTARNHSDSPGILPRFLSFARTSDKSCNIDIDSDLEEEEQDAEDDEEVMKNHHCLCCKQGDKVRLHPVAQQAPSAQEGLPIKNPALHEHPHHRRPFHTTIMTSSFSQAPGIGPGGQLVDVEAFCRDLAFRSFPKLQHWSQSQQAK
ncbi:hypothetical protein BGZ73_003379 [Actinomortierella ambigua]|nr:hypothetical protein BGZ73_003379 [Actinomortierella ambigua]